MPVAQEIIEPGVKLLGFDTGLPVWVAFPVFALVWTGLTYLIYKGLRRHVARRERARGRKTVDLVVASLHGTFILLFLLLGVKILLDSNAVDDTQREYGTSALVTLVVLVAVLAIIRVAMALLTEAATTKANFRPLVAPTGFVIQAFVIVIGALLWMEAMDIPITSILMASGIGALAAGLALQDTLSNLFAGIWMILHREVRQGDFVRLATKEEGFVESIGWRSTRMITRENNLLVIPNRRVAEAGVLNYSQPQGHTVAEIGLTVSADQDPARIRKLLEETAKDISGTVPGRDPLVRLSAMEPSGLTFSVVLGIESIFEREKAESEYRERVLRRLRRDGIPPWGTPKKKASRRRK